MEFTMRHFKLSLLLLTPTLLLGCGGGGSDSNNEQPDNPSNTVVWQQGNFPEASTFKDYCANPRGSGFPDRAGNAMQEKMWLRSWSNDTYLWYDEVDDVDPAPFSIADYFAQLRTNQLDENGQVKDNFHFTENTEEWRKQTEAGVSLSYGMNFKIIRAAPPREVVVSYIEPNSQAAQNQIQRGDEITEINGVSVINSDNVDLINSALFPSSDAQSYTFTLRNIVTNDTKTATMRPSEVASAPVLNVKTMDIGDDKVGYFQFNTHNSPSEKALMDAVTQLSNQNIDDLVVDLRYNGGGLLAVASELAYMVAGNQTAGKTFELMQFNDQHPNFNPVTGERIQPIPFLNQTVGFSDGLDSGEALPTLNLNRVFVLTSDRTCSASEAFMNGLRGADVDVIQIGGKTCGKPYGFYATDNCGTTYFTIQFQGVNDKGFGSYANGFEPQQASPITGVQVPGCLAEDDLTHQLGNQDEAMLKTALEYRDTGVCPAIPASSVSKGASYTQAKQQQNSGLEIRNPHQTIEDIFKQNKIY